MNPPITLFRILDDVYNVFFEVHNPHKHFSTK